MDVFSRRAHASQLLQKTAPGHLLQLLDGDGFYLLLVIAVEKKDEKLSFFVMLDGYIGWVSYDDFTHFTIEKDHGCSPVF